MKDYQATGAVCGIKLPEGLVNSSKLPETIFTPSTKAEIGDHDENISFEECSKQIGEEDAAAIRDLTIKVYERAAEHGLLIPIRLAKSSQALISSLFAIGSMLIGIAKEILLVFLKTLSRKRAKNTFKPTKKSLVVHS